MAPASGSTPAAAGGGQNTIRLLSANVRSLFTKIEELCLLVNEKQPHFLCVQETWCAPQEKDSQYRLPGYTLHRHDRLSTGGGVCIYIREDAVSTVARLPQLESQNEDLWLQLTLPNSPATIYLGTAYRPPNTDLDPFLECLETTLARVALLSHGHQSHTILTGDFNARCTAWCADDPTDTAGERLHQLFSAYGLSQETSFPTNVVGDRLHACLDLVLTDLAGLEVTSLPPVGRSDHLVLHGEFTIPSRTSESPRERASRTVWCWSADNCKDLRSEVSGADWSDVMQCNNVDCAWTAWKHKILTLAQRVIPTRLVRQLPRPQPWVTAEIADAVKLKHRLFRAYKKTHTPADWDNFKQQRNIVSGLIRRAKSAYVTSLSDDDRPPRTKLPSLFRLLGSLTKSKHARVPDLQSSTGTTVTAAPDKAAVLNDFFLRQCRESSGSGNPPPIDSQPVTGQENTLSTLSVSEHEVCAALRTLDPAKAPGCDGIPTRLLVAAAEEIAPQVCHIFQLSVNSTVFPSEWKQAIVTPVYKGKGDTHQPTNYRPISLLCILSKVLERIVYRQLYDHVSPHFPPNQSGFRRRDGTEYQLVRIVHNLAKAVDDSHYTLTCYFDLTKAFDRVWHAGLLAKLRHLGVAGQALAWFSSYLSSRTQCVRVDGLTCAFQPVPGGVPQGSVLGPLLFLVYTHDLPHAIRNARTTCNQFADDTALTSSSANRAQTVTDLQTSVASTGQWLTNWRLAANSLKTVVVETTRRAIPTDAAISLNGSTLRTSTSQRHLGIILSTDLRWTAQVNHVLARAAPLLCLLRRLRSSLSVSALCIFYKLYIRPVLEYACNAWSGLPISLMDRLERFQRRAAKLILRRSLYTHSNHSELLDSVGWETLSSRRRYRLAILGFHLASRSVPPHLLEDIFPKRNQPYQLRHCDHFETPIANTLLYQSSPLFLACTTFNQLPDWLKQEREFTKFKQGAKIHLLTSVCSCSKHILKCS